MTAKTARTAAKIRRATPDSRMMIALAWLTIATASAEHAVVDAEIARDKSDRLAEAASS